MYLMYGEYDIAKQQGEYHQTLPVVDDNSISKHTFLEAMNLIPQQKTRLSDFSALVSSSFVTVHDYILHQSMG